jgi:hypothetical protein
VQITADGAFPGGDHGRTLLKGEKEKILAQLAPVFNPRELRGGFMVETAGIFFIIGTLFY